MGLPWNLPELDGFKYLITFINYFAKYSDSETVRDKIDLLSQTID